MGKYQIYLKHRKGAMDKRWKDNFREARKDCDDICEVNDYVAKVHRFNTEKRLMSIRVYSGRKCIYKWDSEANSGT